MSAASLWPLLSIFLIHSCHNGAPATLLQRAISSAGGTYLLSSKLPALARSITPCSAVSKKFLPQNFAPASPLTLMIAVRTSWGSDCHFCLLAQSEKYAT